MKFILLLIVAAFSGSAFAGVADASCSDSDMGCIGRNNIGSASIYCRKHIERLANSDWKWDEGTDDGFWAGVKGSGGIFSRFKWTQGSPVPTAMTYFGDKAKIQIPSGAFMRIKYSCDYNVKTNEVYNVKLLGLGRFE